MPNEPDRNSVAKRVPRARYRDDGYVTQEVDGFANLTPEQKARPLDPLFPDADDGPSLVGDPPEASDGDLDPFAQLTPEQKTWPVVSLRPRPEPPAAPPATSPGTPPSPPG